MQTSQENHNEEILAMLRNAVVEERRVPFKIVRGRHRGFKVKILDDLDGFIYYSHMPWKYSSLEHWELVSKYLIGKEFYCKVERVEGKVFIFADATSHRFSPVKFSVQERKYSGVIVEENKEALVVDFGFSFGWRYGPQIAHVSRRHLTSFQGDDGLAGRVLRTYFQGEDINNNLIFGDDGPRLQFMTKNAKELIGTIQKAKVKKIKGKKGLGKPIRFLVNNTFNAELPITRKYYPADMLPSVKAYKNGLRNKQKIQCRVVEMNSSGDCFFLQLLVDKIKNFPKV